MGTKAKKAIWFCRGKREYHVMPPGWKPSQGDIVFSSWEQMLEFARASRLILKDGNKRMDFA